MFYFSENRISKSLPSSEGRLFLGADERCGIVSLTRVVGGLCATVEGEGIEESLRSPWEIVLSPLEVQED
jgi:hypothetical protein